MGGCGRQSKLVPPLDFLHASQRQDRVKIARTLLALPFSRSDVTA